MATILVVDDESSSKRWGEPGTAVVQNATAAISIRNGAHDGCRGTHTFPGPASGGNRVALPPRMLFDTLIAGSADAVSIDRDGISSRVATFDCGSTAVSPVRRGVLSLLLLTTVIATSGQPVEAQALASATGSGLRIEWSVDRARGEWRALCGYIYNDTPVTPREVRLLVEGRDASERLIDSRIVPVLGYIAPGARTYFCATATAVAARYSVTILDPPGTGDR
jgi:hypothetical protein